MVNRRVFRSALGAVLFVIFTSLLIACGDTATVAPAAGTTAVAATSAATTAAGGAAATTAAGGAAATTAAGGAAATSSSGTASTLGAIPKGPAQLSGPLVIALNTEITGAGAQTGDLARKAAEIAVDKINNSGGVNGQKIELKVEDAASSNQGALAALNKAAEDKAVAMVGPVKSTQILAISERIKELQMLSLIGGTNQTLTKQGNPWLFRFRPDDSIAGNAIASFLLNDLKTTKIAIIHDSDAFGTGGADIIEASVKAAGKNVVSRQKYTTGTTDFTAQLLAIKNAGADSLALYGTNAQDDAVILRQIKEQGLKIPAVGSPSYSQTTVSTLASEVTEGVYVVQDYFGGRTPESQEYQKAWKDKYNTAADDLSGWNWDAIHLLSRLVAQVGTDKNKLREALLATQNFKGASGTIGFTPEGNGLSSVDIAQYKNKALTFIKTVSTK